MGLLEGSSGKYGILTVVFAMFLISTVLASHNAFADIVAATIPLGNYSPGGISMNSNTHMIYVTNPSNNTVSVINGSSNSVVGRIQVGTNPQNIAVNPITNKIYVTHGGYDNVTVIDGNTNSVSGIIPVSGTTTCIAVNPNIDRIYVLQSAYHAVAVIDSSSNKIVDTVQYTSAYWIYATCVSVNPSTDRFYPEFVTNPDTHLDGYINARDGSTDGSIALIHTGYTDPPSAIAIDQKTDMIYALNSYWNSGLMVINGTTNSIVGNTALSGFTGIDVNPQTNTVYVTNSGGNSVYVINGTTWAVTATVPVGRSPGGIAADPTTDKIYVVNGGDDTISVIQGSSPPPVITTSELRINSKDSFGKIMTGFEVLMYAKNGTQIGSAGTPHNFVLNSGKNYVISMQNSGKYVFDHWSDNGSTNATREVSISSDGVLDAVYRTVPTMPLALGTSSSASQVNLRWTQPVSNGGASITNYNVYRSTASGSESLLGQAGNSTAYSDSSVVAGQIYYYYITAVNSVGQSVPSGEQVVAVESSQATAPVSRAQSGYVASDSLDNETEDKQQLMAGQQYWNYGGDAPSKNAAYTLYKDTKGLHIGLQAPSSGTWVGFYARTPNTNAQLFHVTITTPIQSLLTGGVFYQNGLYVDTPNQTNYVTCYSDTSTLGTTWGVVFVKGNTTSGTPYSVLWHDSGKTQPSTRDCTIVTNGLNYLKVYLDGTAVYKSSNLNLQMPGPFNAYLRPESSYAGQLIEANYSNFYATAGENVTVSSNLAGAATAAIVNSTGNILAEAPIVGGNAVMPIGKYSMLLYGNVRIYDSSGMQMATTSNLDIYGGDVFVTGSSGGLTVPEPPTGLAASGSISKITLSWKAPSSNAGSPVTNYDIYRGTSSGNETILTQIGNVTSYSDTGVVNGRTYFYKISAVNAIGESPQSNEVSAIPGAPPTGLTAMATGPTQISLSWTAPASTGGYPITGYEIERSNDNGSTWYPLVPNTGNTGTTNSDGGLVPSTIYTYRVSAIYSTGTSAASNTAKAATLLGLPNQVFLNDKFDTGLDGWQYFGQPGYTSSPDSSTGVPQPSAHISGDITPSTQCEQAGMEKVVGIGNYTGGPLVLSFNWRASSMFGPDTTKADLGITNADNGTEVFSYALANGGPLDTGWQYFSKDISSYVVGAKRVQIQLFLLDCWDTNRYQNNWYDNISMVMSSPPPSPPQNLQATAGSSQVSLKWAVPSNNGGSAITNYKVYRSTSSGTEALITQIGNVTSYADNTVTNGVAYYYYVTAVNSVGTSGPSNEAYATPASSTSSGSNTTSGIALNNVRSTSGTADSSNQIILSNFNATAGNDRLLVVGVSANNNNVGSITFAGVPLAREVSHFTNNDAEFWYLANPTGTGDITVTMNGPTQAVVGAYSFSGVNQTVPIPTHITRHNLSPSSPAISITTSHPNDWVLDLPSLYGGSTLGSTTCTQQWNVNVPGQITGASSSIMVPSPATVTCSWTASSDDMWDDAAIEIGAAG